jgi:hypothetical protein
MAAVRVGKFDFRSGGLRGGRNGYSDEEFFGIASMTPKTPTKPPKGVGVEITP